VLGCETKFALSHLKIKEFLKGKGAMFRFSLTKRPKTSREPFSLETLSKASRLRGATVTEGICPYLRRRLRAAHLQQGRRTHRH